MSFRKAWTVYLLVCWECCGGTGSVRYNTTVPSEGACCGWVDEPLPRYVISHVEHRDVYDDASECGPEVIFVLSSGHTLCFPERGWVKDLACRVRHEEGSHRRMSSTLKEIADVLKLHHNVANNVLSYTSVDADLDDFMYAVSDVHPNPKSQSRRYEYRVWDGSSWVKCYCDLTLRLSGKLLPGGFFPSVFSGFNLFYGGLAGFGGFGGLGRDRSKASIDGTLQITFSAANGDVFTRCTHNHVYSEDVFYVPPPINGTSVPRRRRR